MKLIWKSVTKQQPCIACKKDHGCTYSEIGFCCWRVQSDRQLTSGGWLHKPDKPIKFEPAPRKVAPEMPAVECESLLEHCFGLTTETHLLYLSTRIGVTVESLIKLGCVWFGKEQCYLFPFYDSEWNIIGLQRRWEDGTKKTVRGTRNGLLAYRAWVPRQRLVVVEGASDTAAGLDMGMFVIGRPSAAGGIEHIANLVTRKRIHEAVVVSDADGPGIAGAMTLQEELPCRSALVLLPCKDLREFKAAGGTKRSFEMLVSPLIWKIPR